ncbi:glycosyltransferase [Pedobacter aquatilis]|uniref:glycosyltransferase n=1 Tax=Pedobacter aquatilis TaxID=351343 RepID=UPI0029307396|nr:glycosyltransferase [Pedobacter aquatilis]
MNTLYTISIIVQIIVGFNLVLPVLLFLTHLVKRTVYHNVPVADKYDYAIIVTAYQQTTLLPGVVKSILNLNYKNYMVYVVADNCDISDLNFNSDKVILLRPEEVLSGNTKSHFYAIERFVRSHDILTIIDSDNLVDSEYLNELNVFFEKDFLAVQGVRKAKNLNTAYACLDEAGDIYYRFIDRKLLFDSGSSASLAGSGMAFTTSFYIECLDKLLIEGAGFDKVLQMEILNRNKRIAFAEKAIVYDEKTSKSQQLVKQRARWINTWFKHAGKGVQLIFKGIFTLNWNQFLCGLVFSRPPLFIIAGLSLACMVVDIFFQPNMLYFWLGALVCFFSIFLISLQYFKAPMVIYKALVKVPAFMFLQVLSLFKAKRANEISTATVHYYDSSIDEINKEKY